MIKYINGDATEPVGDGNKLIIHCCNDIGAWGSGFVIAISKRWTRPELYYRNWTNHSSSVYLLNGVQSKDTSQFKLGQIQTVQVEDDIYVINMVGQRSVGNLTLKVLDQEYNIPPVRYEAIRECLIRTAQVAVDLNASIHCPRFGTGLAKGNWSVIENLIEDIFIKNGIEVTVYDLP